MQVHDFEIKAAELKYKNESLIQALVVDTGQPAEQIRPAFERDNFMSAEEATSFGLADAVATAEDIAVIFAPPANDPSPKPTTSVSGSKKKADHSKSMA